MVSTAACARPLPGRLSLWRCANISRSVACALRSLGSHKLLSTSGISDFKLDDVNKPDPKRLRRNLSAIINFAKFREDRQPGYVEFTQETDGLAQQKAKLEEENERLLTEVKDAKLQRQREAPEQQELVGDNQKREVVVHDLFNRQTEVQNECQALKAELHKVQDAIKEANAKLLDAREEAQALKSQIVPDPKKLKHDLAALQVWNSSPPSVCPAPHPTHPPPSLP